MQGIFFEVLAPLQGATVFRICSGGFRFASTTGYYLPALRAEAHFLPAMVSRVTWLNSNESAAAGCRHLVVRNQFAFDDCAIGG